MTSPDMDDEAMKAARRIVAKEFPQFTYEIGGGHFDEDKPMKIALAAIIETQERCAALAERLFDKGGCHAMYKNAGHQAAAAIRSGKHYGKDHPHA